ncbi:MAG: helix-turn-helix transcriptional regulator [Verrucomicrobiota bacterium]|jgi:transcriptional regulator with XRE-family HTH domain
MRVSLQRHPLAVLRTLIGFTQKEMAQILECSTATVQAVELGKLKLSMDLAQRVHFQTAVSTEWLLADDVSQPPVSGQGTPYTKALFEEMQAALLSPKKSGTDALAELWRIRGMFIKNVKLLGILYTEAYKRGKVPIVFYKGIMLTKELFEKEIGQDEHIAEKLKALTYSELGPVDLFELTETLDQFEGDTNEELKRKLKQTKEPLPPFLRTFVPGLNKPPARAGKKK